MKRMTLRTLRTRRTAPSSMLLMLVLHAMLALPGAPACAADLSADELGIWNDPAFKKRFAESYVAETDIEPRVTPDEQKKLMEVFEFMRADDMSKAEALLVRSRGDKVSAVFDFTLANLYFQQEKMEDAAAAYEVAVGKFPNFRRAYRNLGMIYVRLAEFEKAIPALTRVVELGGGDGVTYGLLGFCYGNVEQSLAAETAYRMALLLDPGTMDWKMGLARSLFRQERFSDAATFIGRLIADEPERTDLWLLQANAFIGLNQPLRAAENYELVDQLGASTIESLNTLGDIYINEELFDLAVDKYLKALAAGEEARPDRCVRAARVLVARGALDETQRLVDGIEQLRGTVLEPLERKELLKLRARLVIARGEGSPESRDEEARVLTEVVQLDPLDGDALILLGQHASRSGDDEKAVFYFERAAAIEAFEADACVRHAQLLVRQKKYDEALRLLRRAQSIKPRDTVQDYVTQLERVAKAG